MALQKENPKFRLFKSYIIAFFLDRNSNFYRSDYKIFCSGVSEK